MLMTWLVNQVTNQAKTRGWVIHRRPLIKYTVIFGPLKIESPYLWNKKLKKGIRPVAEKLGITHGKIDLDFRHKVSSLLAIAVWEILIASLKRRLEDFVAKFSR